MRYCDLSNALDQDTIEVTLTYSKREFMDETLAIARQKQMKFSWWDGLISQQPKQTLRNFVVAFGLPGIGKTTLAKLLINKLNVYFEENDISYVIQENDILYRKADEIIQQLPFLSFISGINGLSLTQRWLMLRHYVYGLFMKAKFNGELNLAKFNTVFRNLF